MRTKIRSPRTDSPIDSGPQEGNSQQYDHRIRLCAIHTIANRCGLNTLPVAQNAFQHRPGPFGVDDDRLHARPGRAVITLSSWPPHVSAPRRFSFGTKKVYLTSLVLFVLGSVTNRELT